MDSLTTGYQKKTKKTSTSQHQGRARSAQEKRCLPSHSPRVSPALKRPEIPGGEYNQTTIIPEKLMNMKELCHFLALGRTHVFLLIQKDHLPVYKLGGRNRFDPHEVWQWLQERRRRQSL